MGSFANALFAELESSVLGSAVTWVEVVAAQRFPALCIATHIGHVGLIFVGLALVLEDTNLEKFEKFEKLEI